ncbi:hypothetical protein [Promicromonospora soli]
MSIKLKPGQHGEIFIAEHKGKYRAKVRACRHARPARRPVPLIAGVIPPALGPMPGDVREALAERARLIEERATTLAKTAIRNRVGWVQRLGYGPTLYGHGPVPRAFVAVAAYRDKRGINGHEPLGPRPSEPRKAQERDAVHATVRQVAGGRSHRPPDAR